MFFTQLGRVVAWLTLVLGALRAGLGLHVGMSENYEAMATRYLGSSSPGEAIDKGLLMLVFGICLGILTEISHSLHHPPSS